MDMSKDAYGRRKGPAVLCALAGALISGAGLVISAAAHDYMWTACFGGICMAAMLSLWWSAGIKGTSLAVRE